MRYGQEPMSITSSATKDFAGFPDATLSLILVGAGLVYIAIGLFTHNLLLKAAAAAYAVLP